MARIFFDFDKPTMNKGIMDLLSNGLQEDPEREVMTASLQESIIRLMKGYKLAYGPANNLLAGILRALSLEDSDITDEIEPVILPSTQTDDLTQSPGPSSGSGPSTPPDTNDSGPKKEKKELFRFFARGRCNRPKDCRFNHPSICKKFRQFGSISTDTKGCDGKCNAFHPNAYRNSLRNKTCSFSECRFYHLKGTKMTKKDSQEHGLNRNTNQNPNQNSNRDKNPRPNQNQNQNSRQNNNNRRQNKKLNQTGPRSELEKKGKPTPGVKPESVFQQDQPELATTLQEIMKRLSAMEARQTMTPQLFTPAHHITPHLSPAVNQPGSQTQHQWASPNQWTQTQY